MTAPDPADYPHRLLVFAPVPDPDMPTIIAWFGCDQKELDDDFVTDSAALFARGGAVLLMCETPEVFYRVQAAVCLLATPAVGAAS